MRLFFLALAGALALCAHAAHGKAPEPGSDVVAELYPQFDGVVVGKITVTGLKRSREGIVRWMLGAHEGAPFDSQHWQTGIEHLYKTESVYEIHSSITRHTETGREEIWIELFLQDKWTLFPYLDFQGGGGALSLSAGIFDNNLLGTFTSAYAGAGYFQHEYSYEFGLAQKWFMQTTYSVALNFYEKDFPITLQNTAGSSLQSFTWTHSLQSLAIGKQNGERVYWELGLETYKDSLRFPNDRTSAFLYRDRRQYRIAPSLKLWKVSHSDYLEQGHELTVAASTANPTNPALEYHAMGFGWKQILYIPDTKSLAYYIGYSHMNAAPLAYQFRLGGFDTVRGFSVNRTFGLDVARANLEFRSTILTWQVPFLDIDRMVLQGCVFTDAGASWNSAGIDTVTGSNTQRDTTILYSTGIGLRGIFLHFSNAIVRLDLAKAIQPREGYNVAFGIGQFF